MTPEVKKDNRRNRFGVKSSSDLYRTIGGAHYVCWISFPSEDRTKAYKSAGVRMARRKEELFVHYADIDLAAEVDEQERLAGRGV